MGKIYLPTKNNLLKLKRSIKEYNKGQKLLEEKELILKKKLENYRLQEKELGQMAKKAKVNAIQALKRANVDVAIKEDKTINIKYLSLMGVDIPSVISEELETKISYGLYHTTVSVDECVVQFIILKKYIIKLAELNNTIVRLQKAIEKVQRRSNALKEVIIPREEKVVKKIASALEESERDEFVRMKVVKKKTLANN
mgnify:CR=1 FL=1